MNLPTMAARRRLGAEISGLDAALLVDACVHLVVSKPAELLGATQAAPAVAGADGVETRSGRMVLRRAGSVGF